MICEHKDYREIFKSDKIDLYICNDCDLIFRKEGPQDLPGVIYENYYQKKTGGRFNFGLESLIRWFRFNRAWKIHRTYPQATSILDIGSGRGFVLYYLKKYFHFKRVVGTQISKPALEFSRNKLGLEVYGHDLLDIDFREQKFDMVTMLHVLEHVTKPEEYIQKIYELLNDKGKLIIEVPNFNAWTRHLTGKYWLSLDPEHHLTFFTPNSLIKLLEKHGLKIKKMNTFSFEYSIFTSSQSLVSMMTRTDHVFFKFLQGSKTSWWAAIIHALLFVFTILRATIVNIFLFFSKRGEVIRIVAEK